MKNRSRIDIMATMLRTIAKGSTKSHVMYEAFVSHKQLMSYLAVMQKNELITVDKDTSELRITAKGKKILDMCEHFADLFVAIES